MKITIKRAQIGNEKPFANACTGESLDETDIIERITRKIRTRLSTLEPDDNERLTIQITLEEANRDYI